MKLLILLLCAFSDISNSIPTNNVLEKNDSFLNTKDFNKLMPLARGINSDVPKFQNKLNTTWNKNFKSSGNINEYILVTEESGRISVIDANTYELVISYDLPEIQYSLIAVVVNKLYNIDIVKGKIFSTAIENIMTSPDAIIWSYEGWFPSEKYWIRGNTAVHRSYIYFCSHEGILYKYDTNLKTVARIQKIESSWYTSAVVINDILYVANYYNLYSYDGSAVKIISTPDFRNMYGLFQDGNRVCIVGGNKTDVYPDPVRCYDPSLKDWTVNSYINQARWYPGVVTTRLRTYIFGGHCWYASNGLYQYDLNSTEVFDHETKNWSYIPTPISDDEPGLIEVVSFYF